MDIACPNCAATYRVPDALIDGVNALRCVACGHAWVPDPPRPAQAEAAALPPDPEPPPSPPLPPPPAVEPAAAPSVPPVEEVLLAAPPAAPSPPPMRSDVNLSLTPTRVGPPDLTSRGLPEGPRRRRPTRSALSAAWVISIALVIAFVLGLAVYHAQISAVWPPFARLAG